MSHFLVGLVLISQLFTGAKECPGRRDDCEETPESAYQAEVIPHSTRNKNTVA